MIFYDLEKAYDYVNHEALELILQKRGFCEKFTSLIRRLHNNAVARVLTAQGPTDITHRKSGVYQGCPLAPLLFNFVADCLAIHFKNSNKYKRQFLLQYADDTAFILRSHQGATMADTCMQEYTEAIGGKINYSKTDGILFGAPNSGMLPHRIDWKPCSFPLKYLGIVFGPSHDTKWNDLITKIKSRIEAWRRLHLSDHGKVRTWNQLMLSTLVYNMKGSHITQARLKELDDLSSGKTISQRRSNSTR